MTTSGLPMEIERGSRAVRGAAVCEGGFILKCCDRRGVSATFSQGVCPDRPLDRTQSIRRRRVERSLLRR